MFAVCIRYVPSTVSTPECGILLICNPEVRCQDTGAEGDFSPSNLQGCGLSEPRGGHRPGLYYFGQDATERFRSPQILTKADGSIREFNLCPRYVVAFRSNE